MKVTYQEFLSHNGGLTGSVFSKMAAAILNFENRLPFHYYWTDPHQIWWECWTFDIYRNYCIENAYLLKFRMAAAAFLNFENRLHFYNYWTNRHQIWWDCWEDAIEHNCHNKMHIHQNWRWRPPPFWFRKSVAIFFTIGPIVTKFGGNVQNLT